MDTVKTLQDGQELRQFIDFRVGDEECGIELSRVKEVIRLREITWLPKAPTFVKGIINLRGDVIPVVDLRERFGLPARDVTERTRVIVAEIDERLTGMVVDSASQVVRIPTDQIDPPPPVFTGFSEDFITGIGKLGDKLVVLLNTEAILSVNEKAAIADAASFAAARANQDDKSR